MLGTEDLHGWAGEVSMKYPVFESGEWITPNVKDFKIACCSCGLVHKMSFRVEAGIFQIKMDRDNRATAAMRRHKRGTKGA